MKQEVQHLSVNPPKERIYLYDNIKCLAIFLVVIGHAINFLTDFEGNGLEKSLYSLIYAFHMPLFIFVSGLFVKPMNEETKFPKYKVLSFILIGIVLRILTSVVNLLLQTSPVYAVFDVYDTYAWFMWAMAAFLMLTWLLRGLDKRLVLGLSLLVGCMAGYDSNLGDWFALMRIVARRCFLSLWSCSLCLICPSRSSCARCSPEETASPLWMSIMYSVRFFVFFPI